MQAPSSRAPSLPGLDPASAEHAAAMLDHLRRRARSRPDGFLPFQEWMHDALYAPGLGYYTAGNTKFGSALPTGDFTTAPEMTPLFGACVATQLADILRAGDSRQVLEFGAGSGALAAAVIPALRAQGIEPQYRILEVSPDLRARQQQRLQPLAADVQWLDALPHGFRGAVVANEVLDAMPATLFQWNAEGQVMEVGVREAAANAGDTPFELATRAAPQAVQRAVAQRMPPLPGYQSEINLQAEAWVRGLDNWLEHGAALLIDYGFPQREYYHPQRAEGTLMCHFRHHAHANALLHPGLQDITTHVDFTAMADAALEGGLDVLGYTSQARFLINAGLPGLLEQATPADLSAVQKLLSEAEMGELFKVLAVGRGIDPPLRGFVRGDRRDFL